MRNCAQSAEIKLRDFTDLRAIATREFVVEDEKLATKKAGEKRNVLSVKRRFPRRRFTQKIGLLFRGKYSISESIQIGEGGMLIQSPHSHVEGDLVVISFMVPGRAFVIVRAQVQYKMVEGPEKQTYYGMKFLNITFDHRRKLRDFIAAKSEKEAVQEGVYNRTEGPGQRVDGPNQSEVVPFRK